MTRAFAVPLALAALLVGTSVAGAAPLPDDLRSGSAAACVGAACDDRISAPSPDAAYGFCALHVTAPGEATAFARITPGEPTLEVNWRVRVDARHARIALGGPDVQAVGSHLYLMFHTRPGLRDLPAEPPLDRITLGLSFGPDTPEPAFGPAPTIALEAAGRTFGPWPAGSSTYRAAVALKPGHSDAVPEAAIGAADLADLLARVRQGPALIVLHDTAGRRVAEGPLTASPQAADLERVTIWARGALRVLPRGRCPT